MRSFSILLVAILLCHQHFAQQPVLGFPTREEMSVQLQAAPCKYSERLESVRKLFVAAGATEADMMVAEFDDLKNLVVTKKGKSD